MQEKRLLHIARIPVRWGDMDSYGHVNNTLYIQYLEEARVAWFERHGIPMSNVEQGPVVLQTLHTCAPWCTRPPWSSNCSPARSAPPAWWSSIA